MAILSIFPTCHSSSMSCFLRAVLEQRIHGLSGHTLADYKICQELAPRRLSSIGRFDCWSMLPG